MLQLNGSLQYIFLYPLACLILFSFLKLVNVNELKPFTENDQPLITGLEER